MGPGLLTRPEPSPARARLLRRARASLGAPDRSSRGGGVAGATGDALFACAVRRRDARLAIAQAARSVRAEGRVSLHSGLAGLGLVLSLYAPEAHLLEEIDRTLLTRLARLPPASLQGGVAGIALYSSRRTQTASGMELQHAVVQTLASSARPSRGGLLWHTPPEYARARGMDVTATPVTEYGMLHGMAGLLVGLAALARQGHQEAAQLAAAGLHATWAGARGASNQFGRVEFGPAGDGGTLELDRRFCVGDPGVLRALWLTATVLGDPRLSARALRLLREDAARDLAAPPGVPPRIDLCCGSAAIAVMHLRMFRETREPVFRAVHERALADCETGLGRLEERSFLYGRRGVVLTLLASDDVNDPAWDALLGMSLPGHEPRMSSASFSSSPASIR